MVVLLFLSPLPLTFTPSFIISPALPVVGLLPALPAALIFELLAWPASSELVFLSIFVVMVVLFCSPVPLTIDALFVDVVVLLFSPLPTLTNAAFCAVVLKTVNFLIFH
eukprot:UN01153